MWRWREVSTGQIGTDWDTFCSKIAALPAGIPWRHNQAGDLPGSKGNIDSEKLALLVEANRGKHGFTFTHYKPTGENAAAIQAANRGGFCINLSAGGYLRFSSSDRVLRPHQRTPTAILASR